jgi:hypothetical protein
MKNMIINLSKKLLIISILLISIFVLTSCNLYEKDVFNVNGIKVKLDREDDFEEKVTYLTSKDFLKYYNEFSGNELYILKDYKEPVNMNNKIISIVINAKKGYTINDEIEHYKEYPDSDKDISQSEKTINGVTWTYFKYINHIDDAGDIKTHKYCYEKTIDGSIFLISVTFKRADNIKKFEEVFMKNIK